VLFLRPLSVGEMLSYITLQQALVLTQMPYKLLKLNDNLLDTLSF